MATLVEPAVHKAPFRPVEFGPMEVAVTTRADGCQIVRHLTPLGEIPQSIPHILAERAETHPERVFLAERDDKGGWRTLTFAEAKRRSDAVAQALLDRGFGPDKPVMILSGNSIEFAVLSFGAMKAQAPVAPVSPAYSLMSQDFATLKHVVELVEPAMIFVQNGKQFEAALDSLDLDGVEVVAAGEPGGGPTPFGELEARAASTAVSDSLEKIGPDTVAKVLFTSNGLK